MTKLALWQLSVLVGMVPTLDGFIVRLYIGWKLPCAKVFGKMGARWGTFAFSGMFTTSAQWVYFVWPVNSPTNGHLRGKFFHLMTSSWIFLDRCRDVSLNVSTFLHRVPTQSLFPGKVLTFDNGSLGPGKVLSFSSFPKRSWKSP